MLSFGFKSLIKSISKIKQSSLLWHFLKILKFFSMLSGSFPRYKRYVDDTLSKMSDATAASEFLSTLNEIHPSVSFTMELEDNNRLPFLGMEIIKNGSQLDTKVYKKPTDTGLLLHYQSHVDVKYKHSLLKTMLNRAFKLSSNWKLFHQECERLKETFARLQHPESLVETTIRQFVEAKVV